jgi:hypothetical protein
MSSCMNFAIFVKSWQIIHYFTLWMCSPWNPWKLLRFFFFREGETIHIHPLHCGYCLGVTQRGILPSYYIISVYIWWILTWICCQRTFTVLCKYDVVFIISLLIIKLLWWRVSFMSRFWHFHKWLYLSMAIQSPREINPDLKDTHSAKSRELNFLSTSWWFIFNMCSVADFFFLLSHPTKILFEFLTDIAIWRESVGFIHGPLVLFHWLPRNTISPKQHQSKKK